MPSDRADYAHDESRPQEGARAQGSKGRARPAWVRWYPVDALDGMIDLTAMEELAYRRILDLIFKTDDNLRADDTVLAVATKTGRQWRAIRDSLISKSKIEIADGFIRNQRATAECIERRGFVAQRKAAIAARYAPRNPMKNNDADATGVGSAVPTGDAISYPHISQSHSRVGESSIEDSPTQRSPGSRASSARKKPADKLTPGQSGMLLPVRGTRPPPFADIELPPWLPRDVWRRWCAHRDSSARLRRDWREPAVRAALAELEIAHRDGVPADDLVRKSIAAGWTGLFHRPTRREPDRSGIDRTGAWMFQPDAAERLDAAFDEIEGRAAR